MEYGTDRHILKGDDMKRTHAALVLVILFLLTGCSLLPSSAPDVRPYEPIRMDTHPTQPMVYLLDHHWYETPTIVFNEQWQPVFNEPVIGAEYMIDIHAPYGTPESIFGVWVATVDENGNIKYSILKADGTLLFSAPDHYVVDSRVQYGYTYLRHADEEYKYYMELLDLFTGEILLPLEYDELCILDGDRLVARKGETYRIIDYQGNTLVVLEDVSYVCTYNYEGGGVMAASNQKDAFSTYARNGLIDYDGNSLTQESYKHVDGRFFGDYTIAEKESDEDRELVLLDRKGEEYPLDLRADFTYKLFFSPGFAVVTVDGCVYSIKTDRCVEYIDFLGSPLSVKMGNMVLLNGMGQIIILDQAGTVIDTMQGKRCHTIPYADKYVLLSDTDDESYDRSSYQMYRVTDTGLERTADISDVEEMTPDGRFFLCRNGCATGLKDLDGNWVYKDYLFNAMMD